MTWPCWLERCWLAACWLAACWLEPCWPEPGGSDTGSADGPASGRPRPEAGRPEPGVAEQVEPGVAEQVGHRRQRRHLGLLQAKLYDVGREHVGPPVGLELDDIGLALVRLVRGPVAVDLVQDALHRRRRHGVHDVDQRVRLV